MTEAKRASADATQRLAEWLAGNFSDWVLALRLTPERAGPDGVVLRLPFDPALCRSGGTICGQALMSAADTAMALAIAAQAGDFRPMTTVTQTTSFMRPIADGDALIEARVLKPGRTLSFGEITITSAVDGKIAAHVTATYAML